MFGLVGSTAIELARAAATGTLLNAQLALAPEDAFAVRATWPFPRLTQTMLELPLATAIDQTPEGKVRIFAKVPCPPWLGLRSRSRPGANPPLDEEPR